MYNFHPAYELPEGIDPQSTIALTYAEDPFSNCSCWLRNILGLPRDRGAELPREYCDDPFVLGFAHGFVLAFSKDCGGCNFASDPHEAFALDIFECVFHDAGKRQHELAKRLRQFEHTDYSRGAQNGQWFLIAYRHEAQYLQHPGVADAIKRAAAYVPQRTTAVAGSDEYQAWFRDAEDCALYDVLFLDEVRARFPDLAKWRGSALESMPEPDLSGFDEDWPALDEDPELQGKLDLSSPRRK